MPVTVQDLLKLIAEGKAHVFCGRAIDHASTISPLTPVTVSVADGDLIALATDPGIYVIKDGKKCRIPDMSTFYDNDFNPAAIRYLSEDEFFSIPAGPTLPRSKRFPINQDDFMGAGHYMSTHGAMSTKTGKIKATTMVKTVTNLGGFHGAVIIAFADGENIALGQTQSHIWGVDGTWIGRSERHEYWEEDIDKDIVDRCSYIYIFHTWLPNEVRNRIQQFVDDVKPLTELIGAIANICRSNGPTGAQG